MEPFNAQPPPPQPVDRVGWTGPPPPINEPPPQLPPGNRPPRSSRWLVGVVAGVFVVAAVVVGSVVLLRGGEDATSTDEPVTSDEPATSVEPVTSDQPATSDEPPATGEPVANGEQEGPAHDLPDAPELQYTMDLVGGLWTSEPAFGGTADDFYVAEEEADSSIVSRYVDGELEWRSAPVDGNVHYLDVVDGQAILKVNLDDNESDLVHFDLADGSVDWTYHLEFLHYTLQYGDRFYVIGQSTEPIVPLTELDLRTGAELNSVSADGIRPIDGGFVVANETDSTIQRLNLDLQPVGDAVAAEQNDNEYFPWVVNRTEDGWIYYANSRLVGLSDSGEVTFECSVTIEETRGVQRRSDSTVVVWSLDAAEGFDIGGPTCQSRWRLDPVEYVIETDGPYIVAYHDDFEADEPMEPVGLIDWETGDVVASGAGQVFLSADGRMLTQDGDDVVATDVASGEELWRLSAQAPFRFEVVGDAVMVEVYDGTDEASFTLYAD